MASYMAAALAPMSVPGSGSEARREVIGVDGDGDGDARCYRYSATTGEHVAQRNTWTLSAQLSHQHMRNVMKSFFTCRRARTCKDHLGEIHQVDRSLPLDERW